jgi:hypothetical protein
MKKRKDRAMSDWDNLVEPTRGALEALLRKGDAMADRIKELEAKLAKAVEALVQMVGKRYYADDPWGIARTTLAELKGENDE